jgi:hypothetical protein
MQSDGNSRTSILFYLHKKHDFKIVNINYTMSQMCNKIRSIIRISFGTEMAFDAKLRLYRIT